MRGGGIPDLKGADAPDHLASISGPTWQDTHEYEFDDGTGFFAGTDVPPSTSTGTPAPPGVTLSTAVGLTLQDHLDAWHAGEIGDIKVEVLAVMRDHEAMSGKAPTAVIAKNWILGVFTTQLDEDAARPGIFANWQGAITTARSDAYTDISGFTYTVLSEGSTLPFVGLRGDLSEIEGIVGANAFAHIDMAGEEDMHGTDGSDLRTQMGVNDILCFYGVPSHHVPCSRCT